MAEDIDIIRPEPVKGADDEKIEKLSRPPSVLDETDKEKWEVEQEERARQITAEDAKPHESQEHTGWPLLFLAFQSTGIIYGDIGTSPLYVFSSTFSSQPQWEDLVGALSIIIWTLTLILVVKYTLIVLNADDEGQGGTFALYSLLSRYTRIGGRNRDSDMATRIDRHPTGDMLASGRSVRGIMERYKIVHLGLRMLGVVGVSMVISDGILTPAQSVLGAIQGITVVNPSLGQNQIIGITCAILVILFAIQPFGTTKVGTTFAPIVIIWLLFNFCTGIYNLVHYDHTVLQAFSPHHAILYFVRNKSDAWKSLGGLLLAFTGVEALFADIGVFGKRAIQLSCLSLTYPALLMTYSGQAAFIAQDKTGTAFTNPFFRTVPPGSLYFGMIISVLAAVVASQAMITSAFQLLSMCMRLSYFPQIKIVHTSKKHHHQIYIPIVNWSIMVATIIVTAAFKSTNSLGNAYGVCVIADSMITTTLVSLVAVVVWRFPAIVVAPVWLFFVTLEGLYLTSALRKVPYGAWFTIAMTACFATFFTIWRFGKETQWKAESHERIPAGDIFRATEHSAAKMINPHAEILNQDTGLEHSPVQKLPLTPPGLADEPLTVTPGVGIFFDKVGVGEHAVPKVFTHYLAKFKSRHEVAIFFHLRALNASSVSRDQRFVVTRGPRGLPSSYRVTLRYGYTDEPSSVDIGTRLVEHVMLYATRNASADERFSEAELPPASRDDYRVLRRATSSAPIYILGKEVMFVNPGPWYQIIRRIALEAFIWLREATRTKLIHWDLDHNQLVEIGFVQGI